METVRIETTVLPNGRVIVDNLPFGEGEKVEVTIMDIDSKQATADNPLKGTLISYDDPFGPAVPLEDWEFLK